MYNMNICIDIDHHRSRISQSPTHFPMFFNHWALGLQHRIGIGRDQGTRFGQTHGANHLRSSGCLVWKFASVYWATNVTGWWFLWIF